ncbi:hypothetical protein J2129_001891 [Methanofollis sp. W23]|nr:hypothetical protein [Methanofollis sp. W23]
MCVARLPTSSDGGAPPPDPQNEDRDGKAHSIAMKSVMPSTTSRSRGGDRGTARTPPKITLLRISTEPKVQNRWARRAWCAPHNSAAAVAETSPPPISHHHKGDDLTFFRPVRHIRGVLIGSEKWFCRIRHEPPGSGIRDEHDRGSPETPYGKIVEWPPPPISSRGVRGGTAPPVRAGEKAGESRLHPYWMRGYHEVIPKLFSLPHHR